MRIQVCSNAFPVIINGLAQEGHADYLGIIMYFKAKYTKYYHKQLA